MFDVCQDFQEFSREGRIIIIGILPSEDMHITQE